VAITSHKSVDLIRHENRKKRGGSGASGTESERNKQSTPVDFEQIIQSQPSPEFTVQLAEELERLLDLLDKTGDSTLRQVALAKMEGETTTEIAEQMISICEVAKWNRFRTAPFRSDAQNQSVV
jgi:DNA-directed RNA polymerase specialized sigma24 family protein